jgi:hypothetical protein
MVFRRVAIENFYADLGMYNAESDFAFAVSRRRESFDNRKFALQLLHFCVEAE